MALDSVRLNGPKGCLHVKQTLQVSAVVISDQYDGLLISYCTMSSSLCKIPESGSEARLTIRETWRIPLVAISSTGERGQLSYPILIWRDANRHLDLLVFIDSFIK